MIRGLIIIHLGFFLFATSAAFGQKPLSFEQQEFIDRLLPVIKQVNDEIIVQRTGIYEMYQQVKKNKALSYDEQALMYQYLKFYRCTVPEEFSDFTINEDDFKILLKKVDIIPRKLVLAQAAIESNWGKSRFARDGNNYFGIRCMHSGCGLTPTQTKSKKFQVKVYPTLLDGIRDYARLLNSSVYYKEFREIRNTNRLKEGVPDPVMVVNGLSNFSSKRQAYINSLINIMKHNFYYF